MSVSFVVENDTSSLPCTNAAESTLTPSIAAIGIIEIQVAIAPVSWPPTTAVVPTQRMLDPNGVGMVAHWLPPGPAVVGRSVHADTLRSVGGREPVVL